MAGIYVGGSVVAAFNIKYEGVDILDYHNTHHTIPRDHVIGKLLPKKVCSCSLGRAANGTTCLRANITQDLAEQMGMPRDAPVEKLLEQTGCTGDKCLLKAAQSKGVISDVDADIEAEIAFKKTGPVDITLFNDIIIDQQLFAWMYQFEDFYAYNFNMLDWRKHSMRNGRVRNSPDTLATISWADLYHGKITQPIGMANNPASNKILTIKASHGIRRGGCIINSDVYAGSGKHWMALFVDASDISETPTWTIEFFNSAAIKPESEWLDWMIKTKNELLQCNPRAIIKHVYVCKIWHQHSRTECGPYSMFYIWARLNHTPADYFIHNVVPDQFMFEFRQHLFAKPDDDVKPFDFEKFSRDVKIKWDTEQIGAEKKSTMP
jgi:hypothetical protein